MTLGPEDLLSESIVARECGEAVGPGAFLDRCESPADRAALLGLIEEYREVHALLSDARLPSLIGPYRVIRKIGSGGMGIVYAARAPGGGTVAVKILPHAASSSEHARQRFSREIESLRRVQHPHVVEILDSGFHADRPYLVMEMLAGGGLDQRIRRRPGDETSGSVLSSSEACSLVLKVLLKTRAVVAEGPVLLAKLYRQKAECESLLGRWRESERSWQLLAKIEGEGPEALPQAGLDVSSDPEGAELVVLRYDRASTGGVAWPTHRVFPQDLRTPCLLQGLAPGSYLLELRRPGEKRWTRLPVLLERGATCRVEALWLPRDEEIGVGWEYIPPGESIMGGDLDAESSEARSIRRVAGFFMKKREESCQEYYRFLRFIVENDGGCSVAECSERRLMNSTKAHVHIPRSEARFPPGGYKSWDLIAGDYQRLYLDNPRAIHLLSYKDAVHYVAWLNREATRSSSPWVYSLPTGDQWERAARGADGRAFPWGDRFSWDMSYSGYNPRRRAKGAQAQADHLVPGKTPGDCSPFRILDLSGNVREFCQDFEEISGRSLIRGGEESFFRPAQFRIASRSGAVRESRNWNFGIRLVRTLR